MKQSISILLASLALSSQSHALFWSSNSSPTYTMNDIGKQISISSRELNCSDSHLRSNDLQKLGLVADMNLERARVSCQEFSEEFEKHNQEWSLTIVEVSPLQERGGRIYDCVTNRYYYRTCTEDRITYQILKVDFQVNGKSWYSEIQNNIKIKSRKSTVDLL